jgi:hypothetical protein
MTDASRNLTFVLKKENNQTLLNMAVDLKLPTLVNSDNILNIVRKFAPILCPNIFDFCSDHLEIRRLQKINVRIENFYVYSSLQRWF